MLMPAPSGVAFRHELARLAIEESLTPIRRLALHRRALQVLADSPTGTPDLARLAHHAEAAADSEAVQRFAPAAAVRAARLGAHREAAAQYARALQFSDGLAPAARAELLERQAHECYVTDQFNVSILAGREAIDLFREAGDRLREGNAMRQLSNHLRCSQSAAEGEELGRQSVTLLEQVSPTPAPTPSRELVLAYSNLASLCMNADDAEGTAVFGRRALAFAQEFDGVEVLAHTLNTLGTMELLTGEPEGRGKLERSIELAREAGLDDQVMRGMLNLCWAATRTRSYSTSVERLLQTCSEFCSERGLLLGGYYVLAYMARLALDQGRWSDAVELVQQLLRNPRTVLPRVPALIVLGLVRARRGDPDSWPPLDEALSVAETNGELQFTGSVAAARAEAAWLEGRTETVAAATEAALDLARKHRAAWIVGELACWRWRAGIGQPEVDGAAKPYALELRGQWQRAAEFWTQRGCPYEAALALASAKDHDALRRALSEFQRLGARTAASIVARRLRESGARSLPRGPRLSTRSNAAHLTARQLEILELLTQGLRNSEIADRLYLSGRTVDHHVSAILDKLGARSRTEASQQAARLGIHPSQDRQTATLT
jgi:DNA-binding CsgD family transcriptional regulator